MFLNWIIVLSILSCCCPLSLIFSLGTQHMRAIRDSWYSKWKNMYGILFLRISRYKIRLRTDVTLKPCRVMLLKSVLSRNCYHNSCARPAYFHTGLYACFIRNYHSHAGVYGFQPHKKNTWEGKQRTKCFTQICVRHFSV